MSRRILSYWLILVCLLSACGSRTTTPTPKVGLANPASVNCVQKGGKLELRQDESGGQFGVCIFPDRSECEEWAYFHGECKPGDSLAPAVPPTTSVVPVTPTSATPPGPKFVLSPLAMQPSGVPLPYAVLVNTGDGRGITAYDRSGLALGEWQTSPLTGQVHAAGFITDGVMSAPLIFWNSEENTLHLNFNLGGNITPLLDLSKPAMFTGMVGLAASPVVAYSTMSSGEQSGSVRSEVYLGEYQSLASSRPALVIENNEFKYITSLTIRAENQQPVGIWFTYHMYGIGGTPGLGSNNYGLYYFVLSANTVYEFLQQDKHFTGLSANQAYAAWVSKPTSGDMQLTDLTNGKTVSFPKLPESENSAGLGVPSPSGGYLAWAEGTNFDLGEVAVITVRVGTQDGIILGAYPHAKFAKASELGMSTNLKLLGWLSDEIVLIGVRQIGKDGDSAIVAVNVNTSEVSLFARGEFAGFAYP